MPDVTEFQYRVPWRAASHYPGAHDARQRGTGFDLHGLAPLVEAGDPRRFDLRASLRDPFGRLLVRVYKQRSSVPIYALADVSASMSFVGQTNKYEMLMDFARSLALSAYRAGDPLAFFACDDTVQERISLPLTRRRGAGIQISDRLGAWRPKGTSARGLLDAADAIPGARALVFLLSDYHLPIELLRAVLNRLCPHVVIPVVLKDSGEKQIPGTGIIHLYDPETGNRRPAVLRRTLEQRLRSNLTEHREQLNRCLAEFELRPLNLVDQFDANLVNRYFHG